VCKSGMLPCCLEESSSGRTGLTTALLAILAYISVLGYHGGAAVGGEICQTTANVSHGLAILSGITPRW
jgi:hypothetical protein